MHQLSKNDGMHYENIDKCIGRWVSRRAGRGSSNPARGQTHLNDLETCHTASGYSSFFAYDQIRMSICTVGRGSARHCSTRAHATRPSLGVRQTRRVLVECSDKTCMQQPVLARDRAQTGKTGCECGAHLARLCCWTQPVEAPRSAMQLHM